MMNKKLVPPPAGRNVFGVGNIHASEHTLAFRQNPRASVSPVVFILFVFVFSLNASFISLPLFAQIVTNDSDSELTNSFAVVELFTSEGCSSCPPADRLLGEIVAAERKGGRNVFALAFHVDYWNYIGWQDPYSDARYSDRQRQYAQAYRSSRIYTPQMIVNGAAEFVGSNRSKANQAIEEALSEASNFRLSLSYELNRDSGLILVKYEIIGQTKKEVLNIALVERGLASKVTRGENTGRTLKHDNVVRSFESVGINKSRTGLVEINLPERVNLKESAIIAYLQDPNTMTISGANRIDLK